MSVSPAAAGVCEHLRDVRERNACPDGCEECLAMGDTWVHLRLCMTCGHVGCCDQSRNKHATLHYRETGHPVIRSAEPGEDWLWCYVDRQGATRGDEGLGKDLMRGLTLFEGLPEEDLERLYQMSRTVVVPAGQVLMEEGAPGDAAYVILDGEIEVTKLKDGTPVLLAVRRPGEVIGEMSLADLAPRAATARALQDSRLLVITLEAFEALLECSGTAPRAILKTITSRLRSTEGSLMQQEKMAALGTMAAGLTHELNNPAAALQRNVTHVRESLAEWEQAAAALGALALGPSEMAALGHLRQVVEQRTGPPPVLDPLARSDREDALTDWLEARDVPRAWELAPALTAAGWQAADLDRLAADFSSEHLGGVARWLAAGAAVYGLLDEMRTSAEQISKIVTSVKHYARLDEAPVQEVDVHDTLENTLVMLKHKLAGSSIAIVREYASDLPRIEAYASELNQVWTNLIGNGIDALSGEGRIVLRTSSEEGRVVVEVVDSGPGIPPERQARIFEPFYTTKAPGSGSGLGLHIVYNIVVNRHGGDIGVTSRPGETRFRVSLPLRLRRD